MQGYAHPKRLPSSPRTQASPRADATMKTYSVNARYQTKKTRSEVSTKRPHLHTTLLRLSCLRAAPAPDPTPIVTRRGCSRGLLPSEPLVLLSTRKLLPRFIRLACPAVRDFSPMLRSSDGEHVKGGLLRRSVLPRRCLEMPLVLLARACDEDPGMLGLGPERSPPIEPMEETRLALDAAGPVRRLTRREWLAECIALRSLRESIALDSESDPEPALCCCGGLFSSTIA